jgi:glutaredoxin 3
MADIIMYTSTVCPYCIRAKALFNAKGVSFKEINIEREHQLREEMVAKTNRQTVPQIFINGQHIGGCDDLYALDKAGKLDPLLNA